MTRPRGVRDRSTEPRGSRWWEGDYGDVIARACRRHVSLPSPCQAVFSDLCKRSRLGLRCETKWGGVHDLKALASYKGRKRLVWLERGERAATPAAQARNHIEECLIPSP